MNDFKNLHKLKIDTQHALEDAGYRYHGGSIHCYKMTAEIRVSLNGIIFNINMRLDDKK